MNWEKSAYLFSQQKLSLCPLKFLFLGKVDTATEQFGEFIKNAEMQPVNLKIVILPITTFYSIILKL